MPLDTEILGHGVYTPREAARLVGSTPQQVIRWTRGSGQNDPLWHAYFEFVEDSAEISFLDLIEVRVVRAMRRAGISLQAIRFAISFAQEKYNIERPLASRAFQTDGTEILMDAVENDGEFVSLSKKRPGQKVFREIIRQSLNDLEYDGGMAARWRPDKHKSIVIDPARYFGDPILDAFGISSAMLYREFLEFENAKYLANIYEIPLKSVKEAIRFEASLDQASKADDGENTI